MLIESMRDVGYTLETALADVIDNAIAADARSVRLLADTSSAEPRIAIVDDGHGMRAAALIDAMRLGSRSPLDLRESGDLGRFGLGLKTASFSQCRRLTVVARHAGVPVGNSCGAIGVCARCHVRVVAGAENLTPPTTIELQVAERRKLGADERLACQAVVCGDCEITTSYW